MIKHLTVNFPDLPPDQVAFRVFRYEDETGKVDKVTLKLSGPKGSFEEEYDVGANSTYSETSPQEDVKTVYFKTASEWTERSAPDGEFVAEADGKTTGDGNTMHITPKPPPSA